MRRNRSVVLIATSAPKFRRQAKPSGRRRSPKRDFPPTVDARETDASVLRGSIRAIRIQDDARRAGHTRREASGRAIAKGQCSLRIGCEPNAVAADRLGRLGLCGLIRAERWLRSASSFLVAPSLAFQHRLQGYARAKPNQQGNGGDQCDKTTFHRKFSRAGLTSGNGVERKGGHASVTVHLGSAELTGMRRRETVGQ